MSVNAELIEELKAAYAAFIFEGSTIYDQQAAALMVGAYARMRCCGAASLPSEGGFEFISFDEGFERGAP